MYTEEEAKKLWCPEARVRHVDYEKGVDALYSNKKVFADGENRNSTGTIINSNCLASRCMMWRWDISPEFAAGNTGLEATGYCGKGGKP